MAGRSPNEVAQDRLRQILRDSMTSSTSAEDLAAAGIVDGADKVLAMTSAINAAYQSAEFEEDRGPAYDAVSAGARELLEGGVTFAPDDPLSAETDPRKLIAGIPSIR